MDWKSFIGEHPHVFTTAIGALVFFLITQATALLWQRLLGLSPGRLRKAAQDIQECNLKFGLEMLAQNRAAAKSWADTTDYAATVEAWSNALEKILKGYHHIYNIKDNNDFRLLAMVLESKVVVENIEIPEKFIHALFSRILSGVTKAIKSSEFEILKAMEDQEAKADQTRLFNYRVFKLGSVANSGKQSPEDSERFRIIAGAHLAFKVNTRKRLLRARYNRPRMILETILYCVFQFLLYFYLFSPSALEELVRALVPPAEFTRGKYVVLISAVGLVVLVTVWYLARYRRYVAASNFFNLIRQFTTSELISTNDLQIYGREILKLKAEDGFPWKSEN